MNHRRNFSKLICLLTFLAVFITACQNEENQKGLKPSLNTIVATYGSGDKLLLKDLEHHILTLPRNQRWNEENPTKWYKGLIQKVIVNNLLLAEAKLIGADQTDLVKLKQRELARQVYVDKYFSKLKKIKILDQELLDFYNQNFDLFQLPEKRVVYHIFKYKNKSTKQEIELLRNRAESGESFKLLAEQYSDSESRHSQGLLGKIERNKFSNDLDEIIFSLDKNVPSPVITTKEGYHVFMVADILQKKNYDFNQVKSLIKTLIIDEKTVNLIKEQAGIISLPNSTNLPSYEDLFDELLKNKSPELITIGDFQLSKEYFINSLSELNKNNSHINFKKQAYLQFEKIAYSEIIYQYMLNENIKIDNPKGLEQQLNEILIKEYSLIRVKTYINKHPELINSYFTKNKNRFSSPIKYKISLLTIPIISSKNDMGDLESSILELNSGEIQLDDLSKIYDGKIQEFSYLNIKELKKIDPRIVSFINRVNIGEHGYPYTTELIKSLKLTDNNEITGYYNIVKLIDKKEPIVQSLPLIREQVVDEFLKAHQAQILSKTNDDLIRSIKIDEDVLERVIADLQTL